MMNQAILETAKKQILAATLAFTVCAVGAAEGTISVLDINLLDGSASDAARRHKNIVDRLLESIESKGLSWDLIGLNEGHAKRDGSYYVKYVAQPVPCIMTGSSILSTPCIAAHLRQSQSPADTYDQIGEIGFIARRGRFKLIEGPLRKRLGRTWFGTVHRRVVGGRFLLTDLGYVLPFYSTHISSGTTDYNRKGQLNDLVNAVRKWWRPGDLTPVIVGDFNSHDFNYQDWNILTKDFNEVGALFGEHHIEHIWIGKKGGFIGSIGTMTAVRYEHLTEFDDEGKNLSDHAVPYAELRTPAIRPEEAKATLVWWEDKDFKGKKHTRTLYAGDHGLCLKLKHDDAMKSLQFRAHPNWKLEIYDRSDCGKSDSWGAVSYPSQSGAVVKAPKIGQRGPREVQPRGHYTFYKKKKGLPGKVSAIRHFGPSGGVSPRPLGDECRSPADCGRGDCVPGPGIGHYECLRGSCRCLRD